MQASRKPPIYVYVCVCCIHTHSHTHTLCQILVVSTCDVQLYSAQIVDIYDFNRK